MRSFLFLILIGFGVFLWFGPQSARQQAADAFSASTSRATDFIVQYREPVWLWVTDIAEMAYDKSMALVRTQLHRVVDEQVQ